MQKTSPSLISVDWTPLLGGHSHLCFHQFIPPREERTRHNRDQCIQFSFEQHKNFNWGPGVLGESFLLFSRASASWLARHRQRESFWTCLGKWRLQGWDLCYTCCFRRSGPGAPEVLLDPPAWASTAPAPPSPRHWSWGWDRRRTRNAETLPSELVLWLWKTSHPLPPSSTPTPF